MDGPILSQPFMKPGFIEPGISQLDILPPNPTLDTRNDFLFLILFSAMVLTLILPTIFKTKIFGLTLGEYIRPIWYFIFVSLLAVFWQYQFGVTIIGNPLPLQVSQWVWEIMVFLSAYKLAKRPDFSYSNMFFLGILYSILIHGTKVSIRYFFYGRTIWYVLDRFLYGSLLVMVFAFIVGSLFVYERERKAKKIEAKG